MSNVCGWGTCAAITFRTSLEICCVSVVRETVFDYDELAGQNGKASDRRAFME